LANTSTLLGLSLGSSYGIKDFKDTCDPFHWPLLHNKFCRTHKEKGTKAKQSNTMFFAPNPTNEATPLLEAPDDDDDDDSSSKSHALWAKLQGVTLLGFSRRRYKSSPSSSSGGGGLYTGERKSLRLNLTDLIGNEHGVYAHDVLEPADGLSPLVTGGTLVLTDGYRSLHRPPSTVKSLPAYAPFRRDARHRSFYLWWTNEFRHWWKSSRLLVRLAGLWTLAVTSTYIQKLSAIDVTRAASKNTQRALRLVKKLGRGGDLSAFLNAVQPLTRSLRIVVAVWRWMEAAQCRRLEVGVEEAMVGSIVAQLYDYDNPSSADTRSLSITQYCPVSALSVWQPMSV
jgi:hypothetical protein